MQGITETKLKQIKCQARTIGKLDKNGLDKKQLQDMIYRLGCFVYREYHDAGLPANMAKPSLNAEKRIWDKTAKRFVSESKVNNACAIA